MRQIIRDLVTAPIVVADLTDANPNVYWELGVRQSFKHGTVTIAESGTPLPFDIGVKGTLFYFPDDHIKMREFENELHEAINDCLKNPDQPDSHVLETIGGRGTLHQILMRDESIRRLDAIISEIEHNVGVLKDTIDTCNKNIKLREKGESNGVAYVTRHLRLAAAEMLVISRYIDADETFYAAAEDYMDWLISVNDRLSAWPDRPKSVEDWLLEVHEKTKPRIAKFKALVIERKKAIETIL